MAGSNHSSPDFHAAIHNISLLEDKDVSVGTSTFTFYVNYNHFIQHSGGIQILPVLGAYSQCGKFRKGIVSLEVIFFRSVILFYGFLKKRNSALLLLGCS